MKISSRYYELGIALRLPLDKLDTVESDESRSARALAAVLRIWLRQNYDTKKHGPPTWRKLVEAVDKSGDRALAKAIAAEHSKGKSLSLFYLCMFIAHYTSWPTYICTIVYVPIVKGVEEVLATQTSDDSSILKGMGYILI